MRDTIEVIPFRLLLARSHLLPHFVVYVAPLSFFHVKLFSPETHFRSLLFTQTTRKMIEE